MLTFNLFEFEFINLKMNSFCGNILRFLGSKEFINSLKFSPPGLVGWPVNPIVCKFIVVRRDDAIQLRINNFNFL